VSPGGLLSNELIQQFAVRLFVTNINETIILPNVPTITDLIADLFPLPQVATFDFVRPILVTYGHSILRCDDQLELATCSCCCCFDDYVVIVVVFVNRDSIRGVSESVERKRRTDEKGRCC